MVDDKDCAELIENWIYIFKFNVAILEQIKNSML